MSIDLLRKILLIKPMNDTTVVDCDADPDYIFDQQMNRYIIHICISIINIYILEMGEKDCKMMQTNKKLHVEGRFKSFRLVFFNCYSFSIGSGMI